MEKRKQYETPMAEIMELRAEALLCQSLTNPDDYLPGGDPFNGLI